MAANRIRLDNAVESAAASVSLLCLIHCLALPLLLVLLPGAAGLFVESDAFHVAAVALAAPGASVAFVMGYRQHAAILPAVIGGGGLGCLIAALLVAHGTVAETYLMVAGSLILVAGHVLNWRARNRAALLTRTRNACPGPMQT